MKRRVVVFVWAALLALAVVPAINLYTFNWQKEEGQEWWAPSVLYNFDFALALLSRFSYAHGISTNPSQVFIEKEEWLYLGEQYESTVTRSRWGRTSSRYRNSRGGMRILPPSRVRGHRETRRKAARR